MSRFGGIVCETIQIFEGSLEYIGLEFTPADGSERIRVVFEAQKAGDFIEALQRWRTRTDHARANIN